LGECSVNVASTVSANSRSPPRKRAIKRVEGSPGALRGYTAGLRSGIPLAELSPQAGSMILPAQNPADESPAIFFSRNQRGLVM
jgi:hypothetical protein